MLQPDHDLDLRGRNVIIFGESVKVHILRVPHLNHEAVVRVRDGRTGELWGVNAVTVMEEHDSPREGSRCVVGCRGLQASLRSNQSQANVRTATPTPAARNSHVGTSSDAVLTA